MSQIKVNSIVPAGGLSGGASGGIIQVKQAVKTDTQSFQSTSFADITGLSVDITPSSTSSKILCMATIYVGTGGGGATAKINFVRGSTNIGQPSGSATHSSTMQHYFPGTNMLTLGMNFLDSPSTTSSTTYKLQLGADSTSTPTYINQYHGADNYHGISSITVMEVSG
tara:strand:- start:282 stop:785 length:504 start_codon:yes stop_codon:yes gene_type:complete